MKKSYLFAVFSILVISIGVFLITKDFHKEQVKIWDEASSAKNAIEMLANNNFIVQYDDGKPVRDDFKPPLSLWTKMATYELFGINEFSVRLPSIIAALLTMIILWYFGYFSLKRPELGLLFALLLISSKGYVYYHVARTGDPDSLLIFFLTLAILALFQLYHKYPVKKLKYFIILGISLVFATYTKGIMGLAPLAGLALLFLADKQGRRILSDYKIYLTAFIVLALLGLYYVLRETMDPGYFEGVLKYEILSFREAPLFLKHPQFSFYFTYLANHGFKPYFYFIPLLIPVYFLTKDILIKKLMLFAFTGALVFILGMSFAKLKNEWYISPIYPFLCIYTGAGLYGLLEIIVSKFEKKYHRIIKTVFVVVIIIAAYKPVIQINKANHKYKKYIYEPEREGRFLDNLKYEYPEIMEFNVVTTYHIRQLQFYQKKHNYIDGTSTRIYVKIHDNFEINDLVIICEPELQNEFSENYKYIVIDCDKHCYLYKVVGEQAINEGLNEYQAENEQ